MCLIIRNNILMVKGCNLICSQDIKPFMKYRDGASTTKGDFPVSVIECVLS